MNRTVKLALIAMAVTGIIFSISQPARAILYEVEIEDFSFVPGRLIINVGDMIEWRNRDNVAHSATSDDGIWDSGLLSRDETFTYTFTLEGVYPYHCTPHPFMVDTIVVGTPTGIDDQPSSIPDQFELSQNYPNPFNARTAIEYSLPQDSHVRIVIYNLLGQNIKTLVDQSKPAGGHLALWDASNVPTGVYFYRIEAGEFTQTRKMLLAK
ncbi:MAG: T9SS type A sorting domain-containing protein [Candidatus Zixiibacteriota bacterium]|nr:MAG: T9SS type A sorting domain-containing protein [candidate division Zixibacteria bacterium]